MYWIYSKLALIARLFYLVHNLFQTSFAVFLQENNSPLLGEKFRLTICGSFLDCDLVGSHD